MDVEFTVSLVELKRAFRRLAVALPDESEAGGELVVFEASHNSFEIVARRTSEGLSVSVVHPGRASAPLPSSAGLPESCGSIPGRRFASVFRRMW